MNDVCDLKIVYGMFDLCEEREQARWSFERIVEDFADIKKRYITLGFHLDEFKRYEYYKDFGYLTFSEFCEKNIPLDKSSISRCLSVFERFSARDEYSPACRKMWIDDKFKDFSYSQLVEIVSLPRVAQDYITPDMSVSKIRDVKRFTKSIKIFDSCSKFLLEDFINGGCILEEKKVATSQLKNEPEVADPVDEEPKLYVAAEVESNEFLNEMFSRFQKTLEYLSLDFYEFNCSGKQMSFKDIYGRTYALRFSCSKKVE